MTSIASAILENAPDSETHAIASAACSHEHFTVSGVEYVFPDKSILSIHKNGIIEAITPATVQIV